MWICPLFPRVGIDQSHGRKKLRVIFPKYCGQSLANGVSIVTLDMVMREGGTWTYASPLQLLVWQAMIDHAEWDITDFDYWIYRSHCWKGYPVVRQRLISSRRDLTIDCKLHQYIEKDLRKVASKYVLNSHQLTVGCRMLPDDLKLQLRSLKHGLPVALTSQPRPTGRW
jgi:hypothetical protein